MVEKPVKLPFWLKGNLGSDVNVIKTNVSIDSFMQRALSTPQHNKTGFVISVNIYTILRFKFA